jgi:hypothetical protein
MPLEPMAVNSTEKHPIVPSCSKLHSYFPGGQHWSLCCAADRIVSIQWRAGDPTDPSYGMGGLENFAGRRTFIGTFHLSDEDRSSRDPAKRPFNLAIADRLVSDRFRAPKILFLREKRWNVIDIATDDDWRFTVTYRRPWLRQFLRGFEDPPADIFEWVYFLVFRDRPQWLVDDRAAPIREI